MTGQLSNHPYLHAIANYFTDDVSSVITQPREHSKPITARDGGLA